MFDPLVHPWDQLFPLHAEAVAAAAAVPIEPPSDKVTFPLETVTETICPVLGTLAVGNRAMIESAPL